jgi:ATP-dependent DNA helicase DinG
VNRTSSEGSDRIATRDGLSRVVARLAGGGEPRPGQIEMAEAVRRAIDDQATVVVRAGTGTGKSLGYLVPAALSGKKVVVATATKALQDQLATKDLPVMRAELGARVSYAVLKGRSNYCCVQRLVELADRGDQERFGDLDDGAGVPRDALPISAELSEIVSWAATTTTGDREELAFAPSPAAWAQVSVGADECPGSFACPSGNACFAELARARAEQANIVVVNLHLYGAHLAAQGRLLPEHDVLIVDEAHELEDVVAMALGRELSPGRLRGAAGSARAAFDNRSAGTAPGRSLAARRVVDALFDAAERLERTLIPLADRRLLPPSRAGKTPGAEPVSPAATDELLAALARVDRALRRCGEELRRAGTPGTPSPPLTRALLAIQSWLEDLEAFAAVDEHSVAYVVGGRRPSIRIASLDVSQVLARDVYPNRAVVLTSATIPTGLCSRLGADPKRTVELDVGSPFAYEEHALLYCAAQLHGLSGLQRSEAVLLELQALITAAGGRTLALFTSLRAMRAAATALRARLSTPVLCQGEAQKTALIDRFAEDHAASLFATMGFWQGVDVPGPSCSLVVIDRIPFPRPDDPLVSARRDLEGRSAFRQIDLPRAATLLAQGAGRLIRSASDRGVVAVLDPRLAYAPYRWTLVTALPAMRRTRDRRLAEAFLREIAR